MSNFVSKQERGCARVWWKATTTGRFDTRLTTPVRSRAFLMRCLLPARIEKRSALIYRTALGARKVVTMTTASLPVSLDQDRQQRIREHAARVQHELIELRQPKVAIVIPDKVGSRQPDRTERIEGVDVIVTKVLRLGNRQEFRSAPDAKPMSKRDICNVQVLTRDDVNELTKLFAASAPELVRRTASKVNAEWGDLLDEEERYVLTAYALRKVAREQKSAK